MTLNLRTNRAAGLIRDELEARGITASLLMRLQSDFDLSKASREKGDELKRTIKPLAA